MENTWKLLLRKRDNYYINFNNNILLSFLLQRAYIKAIGGTGVDDAVKRTLYKVFSNKLAENYNWEGRRGKEPLQKLELMKVIFSKFIRL